MHDARRFLRFVIPGLVFALVIALLLLLILPGWTISILGGLQKDTGTAVVLAGLLASGCLGFVLSACHHALMWRQKGETFDYRRTVRALEARQVIRLYSQDTGNPIVQDSLTQEDAWAICTAMWHERTKTSPVIQGGESKAASLADAAHSIGAARVAATSAAIVVFGMIVPSVATFSLSATPILRYASSLVVAYLVAELFRQSYNRTARFAEQVMEQVLFDALVLERTARGSPIAAWIGRSHFTA